MEYVDTGVSVLREFGLSTTIIVGLIVYSMYMMHKWYVDTKPKRDTLFDLQLESIRIDNENKSRRVSYEQVHIYLWFGFMRIKEAIKDDIIRVFDINDRFSEERVRQIPIELKNAANRGVQDAVTSLAQYSTPYGTKLSKPFTDFKNDSDIKEDFWTDIISNILMVNSKHARTAAINALNANIDKYFEFAYQMLKSEYIKEKK